MIFDFDAFHVLTADIEDTVYIRFKKRTFQSHQSIRRFRTRETYCCSRRNILNNAVLRSFEKIADCEAIRPDIAGIMGAFGAALIARERYGECKGTTMLSIEDIRSLEYSTTMTKCRGCTNTCRLTINHFSVGRKFITGNRCERGLGKEKNTNTLPNLFDYKFHRYFDYEPLSEEDATRGIIGIPRVLNMYENYPFWFTFFTKLGFRVVLSPASERGS